MCCQGRPEAALGDHQTRDTSPPHLVGREGKPISNWTRSPNGLLGGKPKNKERDLHPSMPRSAGYTNPGPTELCREREIQERHSITGGRENEGSEQAGASESTHA